MHISTLKCRLVIENDEITLKRVSTFGFQTYYFKTDKIIGMETSQHPFLERSHLANLYFLIAKDQYLSLWN